MLFFNYYYFPGKFSDEEDRRIVAAVRKVTGLEAIPLKDLINYNISWTNLANELGNERLPIDYTRRWQVIIRKSDEFESSRQGLLDKRLEILKKLKEKLKFN